MSASSSDSDELQSLRQRLRRVPDAAAASLADRLLASRNDPSAHKRLWGLVRDLCENYGSKGADDKDEKPFDAVSGLEPHQVKRRALLAHASSQPGLRSPRNASLPDTHPA